MVELGRFDKVIPGSRAPRDEKCTARRGRKGTYTGYSSDGCRCSKCTRANTLYGREHRDPERRAATVERSKARYLAGPCGNWLKHWAGCRCDECCEAMRIRGRLNAWKRSNPDLVVALADETMTFEAALVVAKERELERKRAAAARRRARSTSDA